MTYRFVAAAAVASSLFIATPGSATVLTNGGFEQPGVTNSCCITDPTTAIPGWTVPSGNVNVVNGFFSSNPYKNLAKEGAQYLDLVGEGTAGSISQTFGTVTGQVYNLSFFFSHNLFSGLQSASADVLINGVLFGSVTHTGGSTSDLNWQSFSKTFTASGTSTTLEFLNTKGGENTGVFLDAISVGAVPEPATWAMMLLGFAGVGYSMRRRPANRRRLQAV